MAQHLGQCALPCPAGIRKVAILDFDVHHGNGTQACVASTLPHTRSVTFRTPFSTGTQTFPLFRPWLDVDDFQNILFARSVCATLDTQMHATVFLMFLIIECKDPLSMAGSKAGPAQPVMHL